MLIHKGNQRLSKDRFYLKVRGKVAGQSKRKRFKVIRKAIDEYHNLMHKDKCDFSKTGTMLKVDLTPKE